MLICLFSGVVGLPQPVDPTKRSYLSGINLTPNRQTVCLHCCWSSWSKMVWLRTNPETCLVHNSILSKILLPKYLDRSFFTARQFDARCYSVSSPSPQKNPFPSDLSHLVENRTSSFSITRLQIEQSWFSPRMSRRYFYKVLYSMQFSMH